MVEGKRITVVMPAYNAEKTLESTLKDIPDIVDEVIITDDGSTDDTLKIAKNLGIKYILQHHVNRGYGANQKTCYQKALEINSDIIIMLHPDYQYNPKLIPSMVSLLIEEVYDVVLGSRILSRGALHGGMPVYKYVANRMLTFFQNLCTGQKLSEYHTGYRAYTRKALSGANLESLSDDFIFDNQLLAQFIYKEVMIGEISCPAKYFTEASSINWRRSIVYGFGVVWVSILFVLNKWGIASSKIFI